MVLHMANLARIMVKVLQMANNSFVKLLAKVAVVQWLRIQVLVWRSLVRILVRLFFQHFCTPFLPRSDCSIRGSPSHDFTLVWFLLYNFIIVTLLLFKLSKGTATMINLSTHQYWFTL